MCKSDDVEQPQASEEMGMTDTLSEYINKPPELHDPKPHHEGERAGHRGKNTPTDRRYEQERTPIRQRPIG
jgi:hypothetical protein